MNLQPRHPSGKEIRAHPWTRNEIPATFDSASLHVVGDHLRRASRNRPPERRSDPVRTGLIPATVWKMTRYDTPGSLAVTSPRGKGDIMQLRRSAKGSFLHRPSEAYTLPTLGPTVKIHATSTPPRELAQGFAGTHDCAVPPSPQRDVSTPPLPTPPATDAGDVEGTPGTPRASRTEGEASAPRNKETEGAVQGEARSETSTRPDRPNGGGAINRHHP